MKKIKYSEITPEKIYRNRRSFIKSMGLGAGSIALTSIPFINSARSDKKISLLVTKILLPTIIITSLVLQRVILILIHKILKQHHGSISIEGEVENPIKLSMEEITETFISEERIHRLRCVEGWSMVIPWMGFSLSELII